MSYYSSSSKKKGIIDWTLKLEKNVSFETEEAF